MALRRQFSEPHPRNNLICDICYVHYNRSTHKPLIICNNGHPICSYCIKLVRKSKKCPFCRQDIDVDRIRINYDVLHKLTPEPSEANVRYQKQQPQYFQMTPQVSEEEESESYRDMEMGMLREMQEEWQLERMYMIEEVNRKRALLCIATIFFVLPFFILDVYFGSLYSQPSNCTQSPKLLGVMSLKHWFLFIGGAEAMYLCIFLMGIVRRVCGGEYQAMFLNCYQQMYGIGILVKSLICCVVQLILFFAITASSCSGAVYGYGIALTCLHLIKLTTFLMSLIRNWCCN